MKKLLFALPLILLLLHACKRPQEINPVDDTHTRTSIWLLDLKEGALREFIEADATFQFNTDTSDHRSYGFSLNAAFLKAGHDPYEPQLSYNVSAGKLKFNQFNFYPEYDIVKDQITVDYRQTFYGSEYAGLVGKPIAVSIEGTVDFPAIDTVYVYNPHPIKLEVVQPSKKDGMLLRWNPDSANPVDSVGIKVEYSTFWLEEEIGMLDLWYETWIDTIVYDNGELFIPPSELDAFLDDSEINVFIFRANLQTVNAEGKRLFFLFNSWDRQRGILNN